jgi:hypothetical protein
MQLCPSDFKLDDLDIHGGAVPPEIAAHLASCAHCSARRAARAALRAEFHAEVATDLWRAIQRRQAAVPGRRWRLWMGMPVLAAAAATILLIAWPGQKPGIYTGPKGGPSLEVFCRRADQTFRLEPGQPLVPGDELRFLPQAAPPQARYILIGSVDGGGRYTPFYPSHANDQSVPLPPQGEALPGGIRIDDAPGPERLLVILSLRPISVASAASIAEAQAARLGPIHDIAGEEVTSTWQVLPKSSRKQ